jgi:hypothetical protein
LVKLAVATRESSSLETIMTFRGDLKCSRGTANAVGFREGERDGRNVEYNVGLIVGDDDREVAANAA